MKMNRVKVGLLGGLDEVGKVCLVIEIENEIFVFDAGIKKLIEVDLGINYLIPDFQYLVANKARVKGLFLSSASSNWNGATKFLLRKIPQLPIFASKWTTQILQTHPNISSSIKKNLHSLGSQPQIFKSCTIQAFASAGNMPGNSGFLLRFQQQQIVYAPTFLLSNEIIFKTDFRMLLNPRFQTVLLIANAQHGEYAGFASPKNALQPWIEQGLKATVERIYLACFDDEWAKIYELLKILRTRKEGVEVVFFDQEFGTWYQKNLPDVVSNAVKSSPNAEGKKRQIVIITGNEKWLFSRIRVLINNKSHQYALNAASYFLLLVNRKEQSNEIDVYNLLNNLATTSAEVEFLNAKKLLPMVGGIEDLKFLIQNLRPKYFFPINGYYQDLKTVAKKLEGLLTSAQFLFRQNGEITFFQKEEFALSGKPKFFPLETVFVETNDEKFLKDSAVQQRQNLGEKGLFLATLIFQTKHQKIQTISPLLTKYVGIALNEIKRGKIDDLVSKIIKKNLKNETKTSSQIGLIEEKVRSEIAHVFKQELNLIPLIGIKVINEKG